MSDNNTVQQSNLEPLVPYIAALSKEIDGMRKEKGDKYKVTNGRRVDFKNNRYYYSFDMEDDKYFPDDTPVTILLKTSGKEQKPVPGTILSSGDFQITIITEINMGLGDLLSSAMIRVELWKLLEAQRDRVNELCNNPSAIVKQLVLESREVSTKDSIAKISKGQDNVKKMIDKNIITFVWGPPGTGKTHTMSEVAINYMLQGKKVLIVSHSNVSVDGVIKKIHSLLQGKEQLRLKNDGKILRYGYIRDGELAADVKASAFKYALNKYPKLIETYNTLYRLHRELKTELKKTNTITLWNLNRYTHDLVKIETDYAKYRKMGYDSLGIFSEKISATKKEKIDSLDVHIKEQLKRIKKMMKTNEENCAKESYILGTTITKGIVDPIFKDMKYDLVMFDEVSMAYVTQIVCAAGLSKDKLVCVGDFKQLAPIARQQGSLLEKDIFYYAKILDPASRMYYHPWLVMIDEQRRMHPDISAFVRTNVYEGLLQNHESTKTSRNEVVKCSPLRNNAIGMIDLMGTYCAATKNSNNSRYNMLSAFIAVAIAVEANRKCESVGIITPYAAQARLIRAILSDTNPENKEAIKCSTVHQFQGSECDIIIFDGVESYGLFEKPGILMSKDMNSVERLINVAVTRARGKLINISNSQFWNKWHEQEPSNIYCKFNKYLRENSTVVSGVDDSLQNLINGIDLGKNMQLYASTYEYIKILQNDIKQAKSRIIVMIPDSDDDSEILASYLEAAVCQKAKVTVIPNNVLELNENLKPYVESRRGAIFPLIYIDNKILWYGALNAHTKFKVTGGEFKTIYPIVGRFTGKSTIDMIASLCDLVDQAAKTLEQAAITVDKEIDSTANEVVEDKKPLMDMVDSTGLKGYICRNYKCEKCGQPLYMAKERMDNRDVYRMKCSNVGCNCKRFLDYDVVKEYIGTTGGVCPHDFGELKAGFKRETGVYVRCSEGHFVKLEEI